MLLFLIKVLEVLGYVVMAFVLSTFVSVIVLWTTGFLPFGGWTPDALTVTIGQGMGQAGITLAMAALAFPMVSLMPKLRWLWGWWVAVVLANLVMIAAGVNAYWLQNP